MKPVVTWIVVANARKAKVLAHRGAGKGLSELEARNWTAEVPTQPRDRAGMGHSIAGPGVSAVEINDQQHQSDLRFAKDVSDHLTRAYADKAFQRLIVVAGPHMLGLLRTCLGDRLREAVIGEIDKDLCAQSLPAIERHLGEIIAV